MLFTAPIFFVLHPPLPCPNLSPVRMNDNFRIFLKDRKYPGEFGDSCVYESMSYSFSFGTHIFQTIAQNFFLQISTDSFSLCLFRSWYEFTSQRNFGARSLILDMIRSSSLIIIKPCTYNILITFQSTTSVSDRK